MATNRFWNKTYDSGLIDIDPGEFETTIPDICNPVFLDFPGKTALIFMGMHMTYAQLDRYANRFAGMLLSLGLKKGSVVGINLPNIPEYAIAWLGTLRAGCVVSGVSPLLGSEEMASQLYDSNAAVLVTLDAIHETKVMGIASRLPDLQAVIATNAGAFLPGVKRLFGRMLGKIPKGRAHPLEGNRLQLFKDVIHSGRYSESNPQIDLSPDDIACLPYTGGTTGTPKGVLLSHRNIVADTLIHKRWAGHEPDKGAALIGIPFTHIVGLRTLPIAVSLGVPIILIPDPRNTDHICSELKTYKPRLMVNVPSLYLLLMANPRFRTLDHSRLQVCISAAAPFPEEAQRDFEAVVGKGKLIEVYTMTETSGVSVSNPVKGRKKAGTIGVPVLNTDIRLVDPATNQEVKAGEPGEICIKGPQVMVGYHNRHEEDRQAMDEDGYLYTGDVALQDEEGYLSIVDRTKDMIIVSGITVFSARVEEVLNRHPAVLMAAAIGIADPERPGGEIVKAYAALKPGHDMGREMKELKGDILDYARHKLAPHEVPGSLEIRQELPLTVMGTIDKKVLRKQARPDAGPGGERRHEERIKVDLPCDVTGVSNGWQTRVPAHIADISRGGMFVKAAVALDEGTQLDASITAVRFGNTFRVRGKVLRRTEKGMAVRFEGDIPADIEAILNPRTWRDEVLLRHSGEKAWERW